MATLSVASHLRWTTQRIAAPASRKHFRALSQRRRFQAQHIFTAHRGCYRPLRVAAHEVGAAKAHASHLSSKGDAVHSTSVKTPPMPEDAASPAATPQAESSPMTPEPAHILGRYREFSDVADLAKRKALKNALSTYWPKTLRKTAYSGQGAFLLYFGGNALDLHNAQEPSRYLEDGTDKFHWPGEPWNSRLWAGGSIGWNCDEYAMSFQKPAPILHPDLGVEYQVSPKLRCQESIEKVEHKGVSGSGNEKVLVKTNRTYGLVVKGHEKGKYTGAVVEYRDLLFMPTKSEEQAINTLASPDRVLKPTVSPDASVLLTPRQPLLAEFSCLTLNAHRIHLDRGFAASEGFRNLVVQGPLSLYLIITYLEKVIPEHAKISRLDYRNLAPLFCDEEMTICVRNATPASSEADRAAEQEQTWDVWITGSKGGYAVKGNAQVLLHQPPFNRLLQPFREFVLPQVGARFAKDCGTPIWRGRQNVRH